MGCGAAQDGVRMLLPYDVLLRYWYLEAEMVCRDGVREDGLCVRLALTHRQQRSSVRSQSQSTKRWKS